ncbi:MAG: RICIN domain-containing protein [Polyangiaceae bacterium]
MKVLARIGLGLAVAGAALLNHSAAQATEPHGVNFTIHPSADPSFCVESASTGGPEGRTVYIATCAVRDSQHWTFTWDAGNNSVIVGGEGLCLDIRGRKAGDGQPVQIWKCHYGDNQRFTYTTSGHIREVKTGKCLDVAQTAQSAAVSINECVETKKTQIFVLGH